MTVYTVNTTISLYVPAGVTINGNGNRIHQSGIVTGQHLNINHRTLRLKGGSIRITGLTFTGQHTGGWTNAQMAAIYWGEDFSDIEIDNCTFENLVGFSVQANSPLSATNVSFHNNVIRNCGNGVNINQAGEYYENEFYDSEGFEIAAGNVHIHDNVFHDALAVAVSVGGNIGGASLANVIVEDNQIYGVPDGSGIVVADGCASAIVRNNVIEDCDQGIIVLRGPHPTSVTDTTVTSNTIRRSGSIGIYLPNMSNVTGTVINGNTVEGGGDGSYGLLCANPSVTVTNNIFNGSGNNADVLLQSTAMGMTFAEIGETDANAYDTITDQR